MAVEHGANPRVCGNHIHDGKGHGISVCDNGQGLFEDNNISRNDIGIRVWAGGNPTVRRNSIHHSRSGGISVYADGLGLFEDNDIDNNTRPGVLVSDGGKPTVRINRIRNGTGSGVYVHKNGRGVFEDNDIHGNTLSGIFVSSGGSPTVRRNRIHHGKSGGISVYANGLGLFEDNDIYRNASHGILVMPGGKPTIRGNRIHETADQTPGSGSVIESEYYFGRILELEDAIVDILLEELEQGRLSEDEMSIISAFVLHGIDGVANRLAEQRFLDELSRRWCVFEAIEPTRVPWEAWPPTIRRSELT